MYIPRIASNKTHPAMNLAMLYAIVILHLN